MNTNLKADKDSKVNTNLKADKDSTINTNLKADKDSTINTNLKADKDSRVNTNLEVDNGSRMNRLSDRHWEYSDHRPRVQRQTHAGNFDSSAGLTRPMNCGCLMTTDMN